MLPAVPAAAAPVSLLIAFLPAHLEHLLPVPPGQSRDKNKDLVHTACDEKSGVKAM